MNDWFFENQFDMKGFGIQLKIKERLFKKKSAFQEIEIMESYDYGKVFVLDNMFMVTERDEFYYHEILSHPSLFVHQKPENVLIIGGGDCGTLREVLKHPDVKNAHLCELDGDVIEACKKYFPFTTKAISDPRSRVFVEDGFKFLQNNKSTYDVILIDSTDPIGEAVKLFEADFFDLCFNALNDKGILAGQAGCFMYDVKVPVDVYHILKKKFPVARMYTGLTPTYPSGFWSFYFASKKYDLLKDFEENKVKNSKIELQYYNEDIHKASLALPNFFKKAIKK